MGAMVSCLPRFFHGWLPWPAATPGSAGPGGNSYPVPCGDITERTTEEDPPEGAGCLNV